VDNPEFEMDIEIMLKGFTPIQKIVFIMLEMGYKERQIRDIMQMSRCTIYRARQHIKRAMLNDILIYR